MLDAIAKVIISPVRFFREMAERPRLASGAVWVVVIVAVLSLGTSYFVSAPQTEALGEQGPFGLIGLLSALIGTLVATFVIWLVQGLLVRIAAGMEARPWAVAGYAMAPDIIIATVILIIAALFPINVSPVNVSPQDPQAFQQALRQLQQEVGASVLGRSSQILTYVGSLWSLVLVFLGVRALTGSTAKAVTSAVLIIALSAAFILLPLLLAPAA